MVKLSKFIPEIKENNINYEDIEHILFDYAAEKYDSSITVESSVVYKEALQNSIDVHGNEDDTYENPKKEPGPFDSAHDKFYDKFSSLDTPDQRAKLFPEQKSVSLDDFNQFWVEHLEESFQIEDLDYIVSSFIKNNKLYIKFEE